jgi:hypothetical protein
MKRLTLVAPIALVALVALVAPAFADVTLKSTGSGKGMGMGGTMTVTTYIKGNKMRTDSIMGDTTRTMIFDVDAQRIYSFDSKKKEAESWDMQAFGANMSQSVDTSAMKASIKPNGQTKPLAGKTANGYDMELSVPATMGGKDGMKITVILAGPVWIVKGVPGTEEYLNFYKAAVDKGFIFSDPRGAKGNPGQAKAMAEMYKQLAATGGMPYEQETNFRMTGEGPMAGMFAKMNISMTQTVQSVETGALAATLFAPPADYKIKEQK